jgi:predicted TIM-barrel fold metal-dependent hydrolase
MKMIDAHCHLFNEDVLNQTGKVLVYLAEIITELIEMPDLADILKKVDRINAFIDITQFSAPKIAQDMYKVYGDIDGPVIVPLMYDMFYLTHDLDAEIAAGKNAVDDLEQLRGKVDGLLLDKVKQKIALLFDKTKGVAQEFADKNALATLDLIRHNSFDIQVSDMTLLKDLFGDRVYPFMSFDPRRYRNLDLIKSKVGPDKPFRGVKIYAPLGFSAADPAMMAPGGLYEHCVLNDIPIIAHCCCPGMPTMNDHLDVVAGSWVFVSDGSAMPKDDGRCSEYNNGAIVQLKMDETVDFSGSGSRKKSLYFNHPDIWEVVLKKYPNLRIDLAHFGGDSTAWRDKIADMILSDMYPNLYTDLSCQDSEDVLNNIRKWYGDSDQVKRRLMYGSDFTILVLYDDLNTFFRMVEGTFPMDGYGDVYLDNAKRFLKLQ